jgi:alkanesulfonate monooxygenase SsuD/methylene tetrahydromethanopterin reductase-like flavin-dependent oxidoreductase (luciferase family)
VRFGVSPLPSAPAPELVRRWRELDSLEAFDVIWLPDQLAPRPGLRWLEAWTLLGALARETSRARIGPLVSPLTLRNPAVLARAAITLDELSGGRAELGVGAGGVELDDELAGTRGGRGLRRFVARIDGVWADARLEPSGTVPLTIGGMSESILRLAAERANRWSSYGGVDADPAEAATLATAHNRRLDELCAEVGRDPRSLTRSILLGYLWVRETPWRSEDAFLEVVERWRGAGMDEIVFVHPPQAAMPDGAVAEGVFGHVARAVMPSLA